MNSKNCLNTGINDPISVVYKTDRFINPRYLGVYHIYILPHE